MATTVEDRKMEAKETTDRHIASCQEAQTQLENELRNLTNLQEKIREENRRIESEVLSKMVNVISLNNRTLNELHLTRDVLLSLQGANYNNNGVENVNGSFDDSTENTFGENDSPLDELEEWTQHTSENIRRTEEKIDTVLDVLNSKTESSEEETTNLIIP